MLSVEATHKGFSFAVLEGPEQLVDWGGREVPDAGVATFLEKLGRLIDRYRPDLLVLEEPAGSRKGAQVRERLVWAEQYSADRAVPCRALPRASLLQYAPSAQIACKHDLAECVARQFPELSRSLPRRRRPWESEPRVIAVFVAVARGCAVFNQRASIEDWADAT